MADAEKKDYVLIERIGTGPSIGGYDAFLCEWKDVSAFLIPALEQAEANEPYTVRFTYLPMTATEYEAYCEDNGVECV